jgi:uncharacterized membrane protein YbaN (DUF454 family)
MILRLTSLGLGYGFIALGVIGVILPILHGTLFVVAGLVILSRHEPWAAALLARLKNRHPRIRSVIDRGERLTQRWMRRATVKVGRLLKPARGA